MVRNFTQKLHFTASSIWHFPEISRPEFHGRLEEYRKTNSPELRLALINELNPGTKEFLAKIGVELPTDLVFVRLNLGSFLYDVYLVDLPVYQAPLKIAYQQRQLQDLSARLMGEEPIVLKPEERTKIKAVLNDDAMWSRLQASAYIGDPEDEEEKKQYLKLTPKAVYMFDKIIAKSIELIEKEEGQDASGGKSS